MAKDYDDEMLTEEERAALEVDGDDAGTLDEEEPQGTPPAAKAEGEEAEGDDEEEADDADLGEEEEEADEEPAAAAVEEEPEPEAEALPPAPNINVAKVNEVLNGYKDRRKELLEEFNNGDLTDEEFEQQIDTLEETVADARFAARQVQAYEAQAGQQWDKAVDGYFERYPEFKASEATMNAFDGIVRAVTADPDYASLSFTEQLEQAHAMLEVKAKGLKMKGVPKLKVAAKAKPGRTVPEGDDLSEPPRTLAKAPSSEITSNDDEFAALRALEEAGGEPFEKAMARMSPEDRDRFSSMA